MTFFLSSIGRRVGLVELLRETYPKCRVIAGDYLATSPAVNMADMKVELPYKIDDHYMEMILEICIEEKVDFVIPLIDTELRLFAKYKFRFLEQGIHIMVSSEKAIEIAMDKMKTFDFFKTFSTFNTPFSVLLSEAENVQFQSSKVVLKPTNGSSGNGIYIIEKEKIKTFSKLMDLDIESYMVQEFVDFDTEVTTDCFCYENGVVSEICQRKRLKVRGGEVEQAKTIKDPKILEIINEITEKLTFFGVINVQVMIKSDDYYLGEINARFGGGFPLSCYAGANMLENFRLIVEGKQKQYAMSRYKEDFCMLRYDAALYLPEDEIRW